MIDGHEEECPCLEDSGLPTTVHHLTLNSSKWWLIKQLMDLMNVCDATTPDCDIRHLAVHFNGHPSYIHLMRVGEDDEDLDICMEVFDEA